MQEGRVKWFDDKKGFGFIESNGHDYFAHYKEIQGNGFKTLREGQTITFSPAEGLKGKVARNISYID